MSARSGTAATLDQLEAQLLADAREELGPEPERLDALWKVFATSSALLTTGAGGMVGGTPAGSSLPAPPHSGPGQVPPQPSELPPAHVPQTFQAASLTDPPPAAGLGVGQVSRTARSLGGATFRLRTLVGVAAGGILVGFLAGYGSSRLSADPTGSQASLAATSVSRPSLPGQATPNSAAAAQAGPRSEGASSTGLEANKAELPVGGSASTKQGNAGKPTFSPAGTLRGLEKRTASKEAKAVPSFYEELDYLRRAQSALTAGNAALALGLMTTLDELQPGGALLSERNVTKVLALCQVGDTGRATKIAQRLVDSGKASLYAERLENSCARLVLEGTGTQAAAKTGDASSRATSDDRAGGPPSSPRGK